MSTNPPKTVEHPFLTSAIFALAAIEDRLSRSEPGSRDYIAQSVLVAKEMAALGVKILFKSYWPGESWLHLMSLPSAVAEIFAKRLADRAGIRVTPVFVSETEPENPVGFVKQRGDLWIESLPVPRSITLF